MRRGSFVVFALLWALGPAPAHAEHDPWSACMPAALRFCASSEVSFEYQRSPALGGWIPLLLMRIANPAALAQSSGVLATHAVRLHKPAMLSSTVAVESSNSVHKQKDGPSAVYSSDAVQKQKGARSSNPSGGGVQKPSTGALSCDPGSECSAMVTPEPASVLLLASGLAGVAGWGALRRRRRTPV